jgi:hypothetical protein
MELTNCPLCENELIIDFNIKINCVEYLCEKCVKHTYFGFYLSINNKNNIEYFQISPIEDKTIFLSINKNSVCIEKIIEEGINVRFKILFEIENKKIISQLDLNNILESSKIIYEKLFMKN